MAIPIIGYDYGGASAGIVHQDRLVLAGSGGIPDLLMASRTGAWTDFRLGNWLWTTGQAPNVVQHAAPAVDPSDPPDIVPQGTTASFVASAADGFFVQQASGRGARFHAFLQQEGLFVLGDTAESVVPPGPFTAQQVEVRENSWFGSEVGRTPVIAGGLVVFVQDGGEDIRGIAWTEAQRKYLAQSLLVFAGRLFDRVRDMTFQPSTGRHGDTVYVIGEDGGMAVMLLSVGQAHPAWVKWDTPGGRVIGGAAPLGEAAFLVERDGEIALELFDEDVPQVDGREYALGDAFTLVEGHVAYYQREGEEGWKDDSSGNDLIQRDGVWALPPERTGLRVTRIWYGAKWDAEVETLPWVAPKATGLQRSVRRVRILDVALDLVVDPTLSQEEHNAEVERISQVNLSIVSARSGRRRVRDRPLRPKAKTHLRTRVDNTYIRRLRFGGTRGWRDRIALRFTCPERVTIAGLAYRPVQ